MREIDRIQRMIDKLKVVWSAYPDFRLGQLIEIIRLQSGDKNDDPFNVEDDVMENQLDEWIEDLHGDIV
jgi:hypothetical protein